MKVSAVIIACNEQEKIADAIRSVDWADEVLVVDSQSEDGTLEIAKSLGCRVIVRPWPGFAAQKQFATDAAENDWIFSLDADERVSPGLRDEILAIKNGDGPFAHGYRIPRLAYYCGKPVRHSGWYPDWQLRLFDRRKGRWKELLVHESVEMQPGATVERLGADIIHLTIDDPGQHKHMIETRYAPLAARQMLADGRRTSALRAALAGLGAFAGTFLLKLGFLDGVVGFTIARLAAYHAWLKHRRLQELRSGVD